MSDDEFTEPVYWVGGGATWFGNGVTFSKEPSVTMPSAGRVFNVWHAFPAVPWLNDDPK